ncbi:MAG: aminotransferase [Bacillota bacterium]|nr:aminotransferase [Bacillota bacterium]
MNVKPFLVEEWMNKYEMDAVYNIAETCVDSLTLGELLSLSEDPMDFLGGLQDMKLTYGHIEGSPELRTLIAGLYKGLDSGNVIVTHGGIGANFLLHYSIVDPGDRVICVHPTYQQLYSVPEGFGAEVKLLPLRPENGFLPDIDELKGLINETTKLIVINNPNNPTGSLMEEEHLKQVADIARSCGAYVHCDEVYRGLYHEINTAVPSIADVYEKGISTSSMSKAFSLAGLRLGWIAGPEDIIEECFKHRDYTTISCGMLDDILAVHALKNYHRIMERNLKIVRGNARILDEWVRREEQISYIKPKAGTTAFLKYDLPVSSEEFCLGLFKKDGTFLVPGKCFDMEGWLRIGFACSPDVLERGLKNISEYIRTL